jgi:hypothetical protein
MKDVMALSFKCHFLIMNFFSFFCQETFLAKTNFTGSVVSIDYRRGRKIERLLPAFARSVADAPN